jgi:hypothetical protein
MSRRFAGICLVLWPDCLVGDCEAPHKPLASAYDDVHNVVRSNNWAGIITPGSDFSGTLFAFKAATLSSARLFSQCGPFAQKST